MVTHESTAPVPRQRLVIGGIVFVTGQLAPLAIPLVVASDLPATWITIISGALLAGIPEVAILLAIAILGKDGYAYLKTRFKGVFLRLVPDQVSRTRHRVGMVMFILTLVLGWVAPYALFLLEVPRTTILFGAITADVTFVASLLILGGAFWEKLRALFTYPSDSAQPEP